MNQEGLNIKALLKEQNGSGLVGILAVVGTLVGIFGYIQNQGIHTRIQQLESYAENHLGDLRTKARVSLGNQTSCRNSFNGVRINPGEVGPDANYQSVNFTLYLPGPGGGNGPVVAREGMVGDGLEIESLKLKVTENTGSLTYNGEIHIIAKAMGSNHTPSQPEVFPLAFTTNDSNDIISCQTFTTTDFLGCHPPLVPVSWNNGTPVCAPTKNRFDFFMVSRRPDKIYRGKSPAGLFEWKVDPALNLLNRPAEWVDTENSGPTATARGLLHSPSIDIPFIGGYFESTAGQPYLTVVKRTTAGDSVEWLYSDARFPNAGDLAITSMSYGVKSDIASEDNNSGSLGITGYGKGNDGFIYWYVAIASNKVAGDWVAVPTDPRNSGYIIRAKKFPTSDYQYVVPTFIFKKGSSGKFLAEAFAVRSDGTVEYPTWTDDDGYDEQLYPTP